MNSLNVRKDVEMRFSYCPVCGNLNITDIYGVSGTSSSTIMRMSVAGCFMYILGSPK